MKVPQLELWPEATVPAAVPATVPAEEKLQPKPQQAVPLLDDLHNPFDGVMPSTVSAVSPLVSRDPWEDASRELRRSDEAQFVDVDLPLPEDV